jgi:hypothetical protein
MSFRRFAAPTAFALALTTALPAAAEELPGDAPSFPSAPAMPAAPDMRPEWRGPAMGPAPSMAPIAALQPDARTRDAWLNECRRRTAMYYDGYRRYDRRDKNRSYQGGYDYCEAYFDDYYRTYSQHSHGYAYAQPMMMMMAPQHQVTATRTISRPVEEVVTEEYVPVETRVYQRRPARRIIRDKRIRVTP